MAKIKGVSIVAVVKALRNQRESALKLLPPQVKHYLDERISVSAWYPEQDYLALLQTFVRMMRVRSYEQVGVMAAQETLQGVYRHLVRGDVSQMTNRMKANWRNYHDTGELSVNARLGCLEVTIRDYAMVCAELCQVSQGYIAEHMRQNGLQLLAQRKLRCTAQGDRWCSWEFDYEGADQQ